MPKWENYARIVPLYRPSFRRRRGQIVEVKISYWLANFPPPYATGSHLWYETDDARYFVYNPLAYRFDLAQLMDWLRGWHIVNENLIILRYAIVTDVS